MLAHAECRPTDQQVEVHEIEWACRALPEVIAGAPTAHMTLLPLAPQGAPRLGQRSTCILSAAMCCPERREDAAAHVRHIYEASKPGMSTSQARQLHSRLETLMDFIKVYPTR